MYNKYINQIMLVTLDDGSQHKGLLKLAGINPETREEYIELHDGREVYHVSADEIEKIELAALN
jgi:hypothetical protein